MTHIAIQERLNGKAVDTLEKVTDEVRTILSEPLRRRDAGLYALRARHGNAGDLLALQIALDPCVIG